MAHFAKIENNIVAQVVVADTQEWCERVLGGEWVRTSYNTYGGVHKEGGEPLRKNYAGVGFTYDRERDVFIPPCPFPSWTLDEETCLWNPPIPHPQDGSIYEWDEINKVWNKIEN